MKEYIYHVNGEVFKDTKAFGDAWAKAKAFAKEEHSLISRSIRGDGVDKNEFFSKGGCFVDMAFYRVGRAKIF